MTKPVTVAVAVRLGVSEYTESWMLRVTSSGVHEPVLESHFMLPHTYRTSRDVMEREFSILAAIELKPMRGWQTTSRGTVQGFVEPAGVTIPDPVAPTRRSSTRGNTSGAQLCGITSNIVERH